MEAIAYSLATSLGLSVEHGYLILGIILGVFGGAVVFRKRKLPEDPMNAFNAATMQQPTSKRMSVPDTSVHTASSVSVDMVSKHLPPGVVLKARELLASGHKIEAIKNVREATGLGLAEAKALVDELEHSFQS